MQPKARTYRDRNTEIATRLLSGEMASRIAKDYGISRSRIRPLALTYCKQVNPNAYEKARAMTETRLGDKFAGYPNVRELREMAGKFGVRQTTT